MVALVEAMSSRGFADPMLVVSNVPGAGGLTKATGLGVEAATIDHKEFAGDRGAFEAALHKVLIKAAPDIICLAGFMRILSAEFVAKWEGKILNIHPSILPKYKGLNTHQRALDAGDREHGCSVHLVTGALDDGPILGQAIIHVEAEDTAKTLAERLLPCEHRLYAAALERFVEGNREMLTLDCTT